MSRPPVEPRRAGARRRRSAEFIESKPGERPDVARPAGPDAQQAPSTAALDDSILETPEALIDWAEAPSPLREHAAPARGDAEPDAFERELQEILARRDAAARALPPPAPLPEPPGRITPSDAEGAFEAEMTSEIARKLDIEADRAAEAEPEDLRPERERAGAFGREAEDIAPPPSRDAVARAEEQPLRLEIEDAQAAGSAQSRWRETARRRQAEIEEEDDAHALLDEDHDRADAFDLDDADHFSAYGDDDEARFARDAQRRRIAFSLAVSGVAAAMLVAVLAAPGGDGSGPGGSGAEIAQVSPTDAASGPARLLGDGDAPAAGVVPIEATTRPPSALAAYSSAEIETASIARYLDASALADLVRAQPVKCVLPIADAQETAGPDALDPILASGRALCAEMVEYHRTGGLMKYSSRLEGDAVLEITSEYFIEGDALCHRTNDVFPIVIGDLPLTEATTLERLVRGSYAATPGGSVCYRFREAFSKEGLTAFFADVFVEGRPAPARTDARPFLMRERG